MFSAPEPAKLPDLLPGRWVVEATNFPMWLSGDKFSPVFEYSLISREPLKLDDDVSYLTATGETKHILGTDRGEGTSLVWRGKGLQKLISSRWSVTGADPDGLILVIRFDKTRFTPAGIDILVREGYSVPELRALVVRNSPFFGLAPEDLASLTWLREKA